MGPGRAGGATDRMRLGKEQEGDSHQEEEEEGGILDRHRTLEREKEMQRIQHAAGMWESVELTHGTTAARRGSLFYFQHL